MLATVRFLIFNLSYSCFLEAAILSPYTPAVKRLAEKWSSPIVLSEPELSGKSVQLRVFETPGNRDYIGTELEMEVNADLPAIGAVIDGFEHYVELLPGFEQIKKQEQEKSLEALSKIQGGQVQFDVFWEKIVPVFFISNIKYTTTYFVDRANPNRVIYRSQLKEQKGLKALDSLLVIEKREGKTHYYEVAFFEGDFGLISSIAPMKLWRESVEAVLHGALARKIKAENPHLSYEEIMSKVTAELKTYPVETLVERKKPITTALVVIEQ